MNDMFIRIVTEAQESEEEFIFTTIQPFCEDVAKRKISKAELVKLLSQPKIVRCGECKHWRREIHDGIEYFNFSSCDLNHYGDGHNFFCADGERRADDETD